MRSDTNFQQGWRMFGSHAPTFGSSGNDMRRSTYSDLTTVTQLNLEQGPQMPSYPGPFRTGPTFEPPYSNQLWTGAAAYGLLEGHPSSGDPPHRILHADRMPSTTAELAACSAGSGSIPLHSEGTMAQVHHSMQLETDHASESHPLSKTLMIETHIKPRSRASPSSKETKKRNTKACDSCRRQKCKCKPDAQDPDSCAQCALLGQPCTYFDQSKKRGPPKGYIEAIETRLHHMESILFELVQTKEPDGSSVLERLVGRKIMDDIYSGKIVLCKHHDPERRGPARAGAGGKWKHSWWVAPMDIKLEGQEATEQGRNEDGQSSPLSPLTALSSPPKDHESANETDTVSPISIRKSHDNFPAFDSTSDPMTPYAKSRARSAGEPLSGQSESSMSASSAPGHALVDSVDSADGHLDISNAAHMQAWASTDLQHDSSTIFEGAVFGAMSHCRHDFPDKGHVEGDDETARFDTPFARPWNLHTAGLSSAAPFPSPTSASQNKNDSTAWYRLCLTGDVPPALKRKREDENDTTRDAASQSMIPGPAQSAKLTRLLDSSSTSGTTATNNEMSSQQSNSFRTSNYWSPINTTQFSRRATFHEGMLAAAGAWPSYEPHNEQQDRSSASLSAADRQPSSSDFRATGLVGAATSSAAAPPPPPSQSYSTAATTGPGPGAGAVPTGFGGEGAHFSPWVMHGSLSTPARASEPSLADDSGLPVLADAAIMSRSAT